jgi:outer membrane protein TolC
MNTERQIAMQAGLESAIQFNTTGEPTDIPGSFDQTLTLADATEMALRHDPRVQAALARVRIAEADATQNRLLPNPILSVVVRFPSGGGNPQIDAGLSAELLALLQRPRQISAADQRLRASSANALDVALDVVLETQERYAGVQASLAKERSLQAQQSLIGKLGEITQSRVEAGEASRGDQLSVVNEQLALDADLLRSNATLRDQQLQLARLIGKPSSDIQIAVVEWRRLTQLKQAKRNGYSAAWHTGLTCWRRSGN